ncbi:capsular polysaccharide biosynthesis protein [Frigidibacter sp. ROC022]|uniref:capsular polysaccharide biosynthesis protein n=1 Tax=Frigidibacter sp. ROC022 TaxID=2971796 RepID=UPI00215A98FC|nr:capsular polysaccharide biosynthesis protein [Frigidibacter sp. ROC022]MCR8725441.1 capsular polysaccharide biosynthesis protein [Frigidibacter sp. ROC022]
MSPPDRGRSGAGEETPRRLYVYNGGFLTQKRVRRILELAGWDIRLGAPKEGDWVGVWGHSPTAPRGETVAGWTEAPVLRVEDAFLRSIRPGRDGGEPPLGLVLDRSGVHFDSSRPSDLETLLVKTPLDDAALLGRARDGILRLKTAQLSKYNAFDTSAALPEAPYVLVIDQTRGDASISRGAADAGTFHEMLVFAQEEHPGAQIVIKTHPETAAGQRPGHFGPEDAGGHISLLTDPVSPWALMEGALAVYTVSSQLGFEAILAGHKPRVFGQPFYSGWGLTQDENPVPRRERKLTRAQLFAGAMLLYPTWYDPYRDRLCSFETAVDTLEALARGWREDHQGYAAYGMRAWKRAPLQKMLGREVPMVFPRTPAPVPDRKALVWAGKADQAPEGAIRVEDGFLRSRGLGADLVPPLSLVLDDLGIYYDPARESRLERLIAASVDLPHVALARADALRRRLIAARVSKYNLATTDLPALPEGHRLLVPGQVEDDASVLHGGGTVRSNIGLLQAARAAHPEAVILYKPHPDVEAGLRPGKLRPEEALQFADLVLDHADPLALIEAADEVWTMTSLLGFEALIRARPVTCLGMPFYAGWGLTTDLTTGLLPATARRRARPVLQGLIHAVLIDYPRYHDPVTGQPCPPEVAAERLADPDLTRGGPGLRLLARLQGWLAGYAWLWR